MSEETKSAANLRAELVQNYQAMQVHQKTAMIEMRDYIGADLVPFMSKLIEWANSSIPGSPFESVINSLLQVISGAQQILEDSTKEPVDPNAPQKAPEPDPELVKIAQ